MTENTLAQTAVPEPTSPPAQSRYRHIGTLTIAVAIGVALVSLLGVLWLSQRLSATQAELAKRLVDTRAESLAAVTTANKAEALINDVAARVGLAEVRISEVTLQRSQLEELILTVSRSRDDSLVFDLDASIRLAYQQSQLTGSPRPLIAALQAASSRIERAAQPRLNPVQRAMERDIERLQAAALLDVPQVVGRIDELVRQADAWALRNQVGAVVHGRLETPVPPESEALVQNAANSAEEQVQAPTSIAQTSSGQGVAQRLTAWRQDWTQRLWSSVAAGTSDLVRVSRIDQPEAALLAPEQAFFLRENIKLVLLNARLALLAGKLGTAQADMTTAQDLLRRYFDDQTGLVRVALVQLNQMQQEVQQDPMPRPDETFQALAVAASGR